MFSLQGKKYYQYTIIDEATSLRYLYWYDSKDSSNTGDNALKIENEDNVYVVHFAEDEKTEGKSHAADGSHSLVSDRSSPVVYSVPDGLCDAAGEQNQPKCLRCSRL